MVEPALQFLGIGKVDERPLHSGCSTWIACNWDHQPSKHTKRGFS